MKPTISRRDFLQNTSMAGAGLALGAAALRGGSGQAFAADVVGGKPAKLGGTPLCSGWPGWPVYGKPEEEGLMKTLNSGHWYRGSGEMDSKFEDEFEKMTGAKHCLATASGTAALSTVMGALDLGPGDEVIIPPYTFVATYNAVVLNYALPIFVDTDYDSFQIDATKVGAAITPQTKALLPVHIGGSPADLDTLLATGKKHNLPVIEDACQAHLAEWKNRKVGTWGLAGCFSFQASKNLNSGEGGAVLTNDDQFSEVCYNFHNQGRARKVTGFNFTYSGTRGSNLRLCEFQGSLLLAQMTRVIEQTNHRTENAKYLSQLLSEIPGIKPAKLYDGVTRSAFHLYMFRYDQSQFGGLDRAKFLAALGAEHIPASSGYGEMNKDPYVSGLATNKHFLKIYGEKRLKDWLAQSQECPQNAKVCAEAVWFTQNMMLAPRENMEKIAEAIRRIQKYGSELAKA